MLSRTLMVIGGLFLATVATAADPAPVVLFNGKDLTGWSSYLEKHGRDQDPNGNLKVEDKPHPPSPE